MWSKITEYWNRFFSKPVVGQKRSIEESNECPPRKQMKFDCTILHDNEDSTLFRNPMAGKENSNCRDDEEDLQCLTSVSPRKKWEPSSTMARKGIRRTLCEIEPQMNESKKPQPVFSSHNHKERHSFAQARGNKDIEVVHYKTNISTHVKNNEVKSKSISERILNRLPPSSNKNDSIQSRLPFQTARKRIGHVLQETYRLQEKSQYMKLIQSQTPNVFSSFLQPFTIQRLGCNQKPPKPSIPLVDLTKDKTNVIVNKSHENVPWKSSNQTIDILTDSSSLLEEEKKIPRVNSLQDVLRTNPVLSEDLVPKILSEHKKGIAEKRRQVEIEAAKIEVLSDSNRKAYSHALEERLRTYMRITTPAVEEVQIEEEKYELPELTGEQEQKISNALSPSPAAQVLVEKFGLQIKRRDMQTLKGLNWLNDEVINFYMNLIMERGKNENQPKVYAFNTFFYPKLLSGGHSSLKRWTKKVDIFSHDMVLVPVHLGMHWCMAVMDFRKKQVRYYDSMGSPNDRCLQSLLSYLEAESLDKRKTSYNTSDWEQINVGDIPQQMNGSDCGVFSCMFAEHLARDCPILFTQEHMPYFRRKMVLEILEGKLLT